MTIKGKITTELTAEEQEYGSTHVAFSSGTRFIDIGIKDGIEKKNRLCMQIKYHKRIEKIIKEEVILKTMCEQTLGTHTKDWHAIG